MEQQINNITINEAYNLIKTKLALTIIDARDIPMFKRGHLPNAIMIDAFNENAKSLLNKLDRNKEYLVYCTTHIRTDILIKIMSEMGFMQVYIMREGILKWEANGLPITV